MPRTPRLHVPGALHHVMSHGIDGWDIFRDDADRTVFLRIFAARLKHAGFRCYAWALMNNHYHLLVRINERPLSALMRFLNADYARYFNRRYKRRGYLFQDRFKSIATQDQGYIEEIVRYIHLNPLRARVCRSLGELDTYPWTGHAAIMGNCRRQFQDTAPILRRFGLESRAGRRKYRDFIEDGFTAKNTSFLLDAIRKNGKDCRNRSEAHSWVIGDAEFVRNALGADIEKRQQVARFTVEKWDAEKLAVAVGKIFDIAPERLKLKSKRTVVADARKAYCFLGFRKLGMPASMIAEHLAISPQAVSYAVKTFDRVAGKYSSQFNI
jgi:putative transposase